ncbi:MAG: hypothetical protein JWO86_5401 [Myxococcaceae bacterium]|nr:hypothetical protein [Myxococcaceae bacterium]
MRTITLVAAALITIVACSTDFNDMPAVPGTPTPSPIPSGGPTVSVAQAVNRTNIVSDQPGAVALDSQLVNAWGLAFNPGGPAWVSAAGTGVSAVYNSSGGHVIPSVLIPDPACVPQGAHSTPTGQAFNATPTAFLGDTFVFVTQEGGVAGWQPTFGTAAQVRGPATCSAAYKGVTIAIGSSGQPLLFATDFRGGKIDVFDATYTPVMQGRFVDPNLPAGFAPFNIDAINGNLVVTYARQFTDLVTDIHGPGNGYVNLFNVDGGLIARMISAGELDSPWGIAMTPATFGAIPNRLLIGNFGDGTIHVYTLDPSAGLARVALQGTLGAADGSTMFIDGLWALRFGLGAGGFQSDTLYFTAGPVSGTQGVFGALAVPVTVPPTTPMTPMTK